MPQTLGTLRSRLTAWYAATFGVILLLLGVGMFLVVTHLLAQQLDDSLRSATRELVRAARIRELEAQSARGKVMDAVDELNIPERELFLLDAVGRPIKPDSAPEWVRSAARRAMQTSRIEVDHEITHDRTLRLHAERFKLRSGVPLVAVALADKVELEDRYASLIAAFAGAALVALVLVAAGGWILARQSTAPIERNIEHMRRFMADAAHELRSPITVLRSRAEVTLQQPRDMAAYASALRAIETDSERMGRIVEDLLTLARADAGERPLERRRVFIDDVAIDAAGAARVVAQARSVRVEVAEFEEAVVDGDADLLRQLTMILLDNAVKFTPAGGHVTVSVGTKDGRATLSVQDTGCGIPHDQLAHIFERFYRGDPARSPSASNGGSSNGAGLGLSIARWIADAHGATIHVLSEPEAGTTVTVLFPATGAVVSAS